MAISPGSVMKTQIGMPRFSFAVLAVLLFSGFAAAQSVNRFAVFGGYSYINGDFTGVSNENSDRNASLLVRRSRGPAVQRFRRGAIRKPFCGLWRLLVYQWRFHRGQ